SGPSWTGTLVASTPTGAVTDVAGNTSAASAGTDNAVTFDDVSPTVTINQAPGQADPTSTFPVVFTVHWTVNTTGKVLVGSACPGAWLMVTVGETSSKVTALSVPAEAALVFPATSVTAPVGVDATSVPVQLGPE